MIDSATEGSTVTENFSLLSIKLLMLTRTTQSGKVSACEAIDHAFESRILLFLFFQPDKILRSYLNFTTFYGINA